MNDAIDRRELLFKALAGLLGGAIGLDPGRNRHPRSFDNRTGIRLDYYRGDCLRWRWLQG